MKKLSKRDFVKMFDFIRGLPAVFTAPVLCRLYRTQASNIESMAPAILTNPSVAVVSSGFVVAVREVKYRLSRFISIVPTEAGLHTETWLYRYSDIDKDPQSVSRVRTSTAGSAASLALEDPRILLWSGELWCLWTSAALDDQGQYANKMVLGRLDGADVACLQTIESPYRRRQEKNWIPFVMKEVLHFVYELASLEIYRFTSGRLEIVSKSDLRIPELEGYSGSSQLVPWGGDWICVAHQAFRRPRGWYIFPLAYYRHCFVLFSSDLTLKAISRPFFFEKRGIEFCAGIAVLDDHVVLSYGVEDRKAKLLKLSRAQVTSLLQF
jgi:hypothetical protein